MIKTTSVFVCDLCGAETSHPVRDGFKEFEVRVDDSRCRCYDHTCKDCRQQLHIAINTTLAALKRGT